MSLLFTLVLLAVPTCVIYRDDVLKAVLIISALTVFGLGAGGMIVGKIVCHFVPFFDLESAIIIFGNLLVALIDVVMIFMAWCGYPQKKGDLR